MVDMLSAVEVLFTVLRELAARRSVSHIAVSSWMVRRHGLAPLAATSGLSEFRTDFAASAVGWKRIEREMPFIIDALANEGIRVAALKGLAYAKSLYPNPANRPMSDVDLLVESHRRRAAHTVLERAGFSRLDGAYGHHATVWTKNRFVIDLHHDFISTGRGRIDHDAMWERMVPGWPRGAFWLDPVDAHAFHLVHLARNRLRGPLMHLVDAAWLLERVPGQNAELTLARAKEWGLFRAVRLAHQFAEAILQGASGRAVPLGPTLQEIAVFEHQPVWQKLAFDAATTDSLRQLAARIVSYGSNRWSKLVEKRSSERA
jgi:hypothetical protein